jgi:hypothetical protein
MTGVTCRNIVHRSLGLIFDLAVWAKKPHLPSEPAAVRDLDPMPAREMPMFIQTETTPNPATLKFLPGRSVLPNGTLDIRDSGEARRSPLAAGLFASGSS